MGQLPGRLALGQWLVAEPPAGGLVDHPLHRGRVGQLAGGMAVIELGQVAV
jgi:hypothetical protein